MLSAVTVRENSRVRWQHHPCAFIYMVVGLIRRKIEMCFPMKFFDGYVLAWGRWTNSVWLPKRQLWATFLICINPRFRFLDCLYIYIYSVRTPLLTHTPNDLFNQIWLVKMCFSVLWSKNFQPQPPIKTFNIFYYKTRFFVNVTHLLQSQKLYIE